MQITLSVSPSFTPVLSHALFHSISPSHSLCSLMFYLISHNKASLWTAINCVWIFPLRRNRELSERAPVPQAAFILMQRSIAIFIAGSITHVTVVLWLGPLHRKTPDNITAEVCKTIQLWSPRRVEGALGEAFRKQEGMNSDSATVTHMLWHTSLFSTAVGATGVILWLGEVIQEARRRPQDVVKSHCELCGPGRCKTFLISLPLHFTSCVFTYVLCWSP